MDPFDYMKALAGMWNQSAELLTAQQNIFLDMAKRTGAMPGAAAGDKAQSGAPLRFPDSAALGNAGQEFAKLWASAMDISKAATQQLQQGAGPHPIVTEMLGKIFDPRQWFASTDNMDEALNRFAEGPRLADLWVIERKFTAVFNAWVALRQRNLEHNKVMLEAWIKAAGAFSKVMNEKTDKGEPLESWRDLLAVWVETANTTLLEMQRSEGYLASQRELLKASTDLRLAQQQVAEFYSEMFGYPTRAELDDVYKTVTELRRELRTLRREMRAQPATRAAAHVTPDRPAVANRASTRPSKHGAKVR
jgi:class III poly(R)-hydroxyalkanoic acid synthase PhaE subunit